MRRVFRIPFGKHVEREVDDELAFHLEMRTQRLIAAGMSAEAARREALRQFGDVSTVRDDCVTMDTQRERAMRRSFFTGELQQDVVYAIRTLRRNLGFTGVIVFALAVGIGANTAIFTLINAVLVRQLPVADPQSLVAVGDPTRVSSLSTGGPRTDLLSYPLYKDLRANNRVFSDVLASGRTGRLDARIDGGAELEHPRGRYVSNNYFAVLGVRPALGRVFDVDADRVEGASPTIVISDGYFTRRFKRDRSVLGRELVIQGVRFTIVGVTPPSFMGEIVGSSPDVWIPVSMQGVMNPNSRLLANRGANWLLLLGRLKPGVTIEQARQDIPALLKRAILANASGDEASSFRAAEQKYFVADGSKGFSRVRVTFQAPLFTLMIGVGLLLCIICANVANLLLARSIARGREMAVRLALGAERSRLVRQLLTESLVLASLGAMAGLFVASWGSRSLLLLSGDSSASVPIDASLDLRVLAFTLAVSFLAVLLFGLVPALRASRVDLASTMRAGATSLTGGLGSRGQRAPLGRLLIAAQVALSIVLLVGAGMLVRSLRSLQSVDVGLDRDHLIIVEVDETRGGYVGPRRAMLAHQLRDRIAALPGVAGVTYSENGIFSGSESGINLQVPGFTPRTPSDTNVNYDQIGTDYAKVIGARLIQGRDFSSIDESQPPRAVMVNESFARFYFPNQSAIGKYLRFDTLSAEIVGVIGDVRDHQLDSEQERRVYVSYVHAGEGDNFGQPGLLHLVVRTTGDPSALVQRVRAEIVAYDPSLPIDSVDPLPALMKASISAQRLVAQLASGFGVLALLLAAIGLYGVMTYAITRRTGEIGLRVALGAQHHNVLRMVLVDALRLVGFGGIVGIPLAVFATRALRTQLHGVETIDPISIGVAVAVLLATAVLAALIPAVKAARVSPIVALRADG
jgi:predicted permease